MLDTWSLERRAAQLVVVPVQESDPLSAQPLVTEGVGGLILFGSYGPPALPANLATLRRAAANGPPLLIMADEEGGGVQRMANLVGRLPWPRTMAATMTTAQATALAEQVGRRLRAVGVAMDLAPVLDLSDGPGPDAAHPDGPRSFSIQAPIAAAYGLAFARGLLESGVIPVVKHFPGLGQASSNSDFGPAFDPPLPVLKARSLRPFEAAVKAGLPAVMVANVFIPGLTGPLPASMSAPAISGLLRRQLGFRGLVLTDSLSARAVQDAGYSVPQAAARAIEAGADMVLFNSSSPEVTANEAIASIVSAVTSGRLPVARLDDAVRHVLRVKMSRCVAERTSDAAGKRAQPLSARRSGLLRSGMGPAERHRAVAGGPPFRRVSPGMASHRLHAGDRVAHLDARRVGTGADARQAGARHAGGPAGHEGSRRLGENVPARHCRQAPRVADLRAFVIGGIISNCWLLWDKDKQELWDKLAGTVVVNDPDKRLVSSAQAAA